LAIVFLQVQSKGKQAGDPQPKLHGTGWFHSHENSLTANPGRLMMNPKRTDRKIR
jgi:hypothetical protein